MRKTHFIFLIPLFISFCMVILIACGHPLNLKSGVPTGAVSNQPAANSPLEENEVPTVTLQTFVELSDQLPYSFAHGAALQVGTRIYLFGGVSAGATGGGPAGSSVNTIFSN